MPLITPAADADDEADLIRRARERDQQAFAQLYRRHVGRVHAICRRMSADLPRAEELTQTVFVKLRELRNTW